MSRRSVVVVDDLAELRQILRLILEHGGPFRVVGEGSNGHDAIALAAEHHPDLLLMDVEMPGGPSGWEVLAAVAEVAPETLVVILSGSRGERRPEGGPEPAAVLEKGLAPKELNAALIELVGADDAPAVAAEQPAGVLPAAPAELEAFVSVAGHDLAQPLQVASGYLEMLQADFGEALDPTAAEWLGAAIGSLDRMRGLVQALLSFARAGARPPDVVPVDLAQALSEAVQQLEPALVAVGGRVDRGALPVVDADPAHLVTVLFELLDNAVRFAAPGEPPVVRVTAEEAREAWIVSVVDEGPGFAPAIRARAFGAFQRSSGTPGRGPGLGLATCKKLVEGHGGRLWLDDDDGRAGATVRFTLPRTAF